MPRQVVGDEMRLRQILVNLIDNAIKFTERGSVHVDVQCAQIAREASVRFIVADTGIGIPPDRQHVIFDVFEQADPSSTRRFGGSGLGLAISSQLVKLMQGSLAVESTLGRGSVFTCTVVLGITNEADTIPELIRHINRSCAMPES